MLPRAAVSYVRWTAYSFGYAPPVEVMMLSAIQSRAVVLTEMGLTAMGRARVSNETRRAHAVMGGARCDRC